MWDTRQEYILEFYLQFLFLKLLDLGYINEQYNMGVFSTYFNIPSQATDNLILDFNISLFRRKIRSFSKIVNKFWELLIFNSLRINLIDGEI